MNRSNVFQKEKIIKCDYCGKNLLNDAPLSMIQIITNSTDNKILRIHTCCKGNCDRVLLKKLKHNESDGWKDLTDFLNPHLYLKNIMAMLNNMYEEMQFENLEAFEKYKELLINCYPYVSRNLSEKELSEAKISYELDYL